VKELFPENEQKNIKKHGHNAKEGNNDDDGKPNLGELLNDSRDADVVHPSEFRKTIDGFVDKHFHHFIKTKKGNKGKEQK
jgi:hypothetical protein